MGDLMLQRKWFSLVEILVVMTILIILMWALVPMVSGGPDGTEASLGSVEDNVANYPKR